jgi:uncharacterized protein
MRAVYWDSCVVIYRIQLVTPWAERIAKHIEPLENTRICFTELTRFECRVLPLRQRDGELLALYERFFDEPHLLRIELSRDIFDLAAAMRAEHRLKTPDALHLAAAISAGCSEFWTNDRHLEQAAAGRLQVLSVDDLA